MSTEHFTIDNGYFGPVDIFTGTRRLHYQPVKRLPIYTGDVVKIKCAGEFSCSAIINGRHYALDLVWSEPR